jgi:hypothetical protein
VTFRYRDGQTDLIRRCTLDAVTFLRFLLHVLPKGFTKVRHYGLFSPSRHDLLAKAREQLLTTSVSPPPDRAPVASATLTTPESVSRPRCPACGIGTLHIVELLRPCGLHDPIAVQADRFRAAAPSPCGGRRRPLSRRQTSRSQPAVARPFSTGFTVATTGHAVLALLPPIFFTPANDLESPSVSPTAGLSSTPPFAAAARGKKP